MFFLPEVGKDIDCELRYAQIDSHPRDDHPHNLRQLVASLAPYTVINSAPYSFQKAPNWLYSPANRWKVVFHDEQGPGEVQLQTRKRNIEVFAGAINTVEYFHQVR